MFIYHFVNLKPFRYYRASSSMVSISPPIRQLNEQLNEQVSNLVCWTIFHGYNRKCYFLKAYILLLVRYRIRNACDIVIIQLYPLMSYLNIINTVKIILNLWKNLYLPTVFYISVCFDQSFYIQGHECFRYF